MGIFDIFNTKDQDQAAKDQENALYKANSAGQGNLTQGLNLATGSYTAGIQPFLDNLATTQPGQTAYADATGVNGAAGNDRATASFRTGPGYQFAVDQGSQNVMRNKAATGQLASGGTNIDLQNLGQGMADQQWQNYVKNLLPFVGASTANAGGVLTGDAALAGTQNANKTTSANMAYGTETGVGNAKANADLAGLTASANGINAIQNGIKTVASFMPV